MNTDIFKAYDIRGKVGSELNSDVANRVGKALADWLPKEGPVAVGYDMRPDSEELAESLITGLLEQGREVWNIGRVASDMIYFVVGHFELAGGAVVTASHNPGEYNGIKLCREMAGGIALDTGLDEIRDATAANEFSAADKQGEVVSKDIMEAWVDHAIGFLDTDNLKSYKVAVDAANGMAGMVMPYVQKRLPFEVTELYYELDGTFPNHEANPLKPETLLDLQRTITDNGLDFGIAFDGDGDRAVLVDELGEPVSGSVLTAILAEYFLKKKPGSTVLHNAICSNIVPETILANGGTPIRTRVGHTIIKNEMAKTNAIFAGEHSAHYYFEDNFKADSGLIDALAGIDLLNKSGLPLSQLAEKYRVYLNIAETNFEVEDKEGTMKKVAKSFDDAEVDWLDGVTVRLADDSWFNLRPSNTEPLLRMNAEAKTQQQLDALVEQVKTAAGL